MSYQEWLHQGILGRWSVFTIWSQRSWWSCPYSAIWVRSYHHTWVRSSWRGDCTSHGFRLTYHLWVEGNEFEHQRCRSRHRWSSAPSTRGISRMRKVALPCRRNRERRSGVRDTGVHSRRVYAEILRKESWWSVRPHGIRDWSGEESPSIHSPGLRMRRTWESRKRGVWGKWIGWAPCVSEYGSMLPQADTSVKNSPWFSKKSRSTWQVDTSVSAIQDSYSRL